MRREVIPFMVGALVAAVIVSLTLLGGIEIGQQIPSEVGGCTRYIDTLHGQGREPQHVYVTVCVRPFP